MPWVKLKNLPWSKQEDRDMDRYFSESKGNARFIVDESLGIGFTEKLRTEGWNVRDASEVCLKGRSDDDVFAHAKRENRILLTHDHGFLDDKRYPLRGNPGIIILPGAERNVSSLSTALGWIYPHSRGIYRETKMLISEDGQVTFKSLTEDGAKITRFRNKGSEIWMN